MKGLISFDLLRLDGYMAMEVEELEEIMGTSIGHGISLSTFERDLRADAFW